MKPNNRAYAFDMQAMKTQTSLHIHAVLPEPLLLYTQSRDVNEDANWYL